MAGVGRVTTFAARAALPRLPKLVVGLLAFGLGIGLMVEAGLGLGPWEALNQGIARQLGLEIGTVSVGAACISPRISAQARVTGS